MTLDKKRTLWELTRGSRLRYSAAILFLALSNVFFFGVPLISKTAIDAVLGEQGAHAQGGGWLLGAFSRFAERLSTTEMLWTSAAVILVLTAFGGLFQYLRGRWASVASEEIVRGIREKVYAHLESLPCAYHDRADTGDLVQRCTSDVETIRIFLSMQIVEIGRAALLLLMVIPILLSLDVRMTLVALALFPLIVTFAVIFFRKITQLFLAADEAEGAMTSVLQENLTGIRVVRAFARQDFECEKFAEKNAGFRDHTYRLIQLLGYYWALSDFLCFGQIGLTLVFGGWWATQGHIGVGTLFAFLTYESIIMWPVRQMGRVLTDAGKAMVSLGRLREILEQEPELEAAESSDAPLRGSIQIEGLTFAYDEGQPPVLDDISLAIDPGQTLALIGPPGSGKSTLVHLLLRLYDYEHGSIRLDGRELSAVARASVRSEIGVVLQEPFLYSKTLDANVRVGRWDATAEEIVASTSAACVHSAIEGFEHGYETLVGERGVTLSGGQRQRVALARALLKEPPILILDDALSPVDTETEARILEMLARRSGARTTILISHRLSTLQHADRIVVLEEGRIVQAGTHARLIEEDGPYARLWRIQGALEEEMAEDLLAGVPGERR